MDVLRRARGDEGGFTLIETVVALAISTVIVVALGAGIAATAKAGVVARQNQQAGDAISQAMEKMRAVSDYASLAMRTSDLGVSEPLGIAGCSCYNAVNNTTAGTGTEPLVVAPTGEISPHVTTLTQNKQAYTLRRYVTQPTDSAGGAYKRLTVVATWTSLGTTHRRTLSSLVTAQRSGLPLPDFVWAPSNGDSLTRCAAPDSDVVYGLSLKNNGARDSWALSATTDSGPAVSGWQFFVDDPAGTEPGALDDDDTEITASPTVGPIEPTQARMVFATRTVPPVLVVPYTSVVSFTATSVAQPAYQKTQKTTTTVQATPCSGGTPTPPPPSGATPPPQPTGTCPTAVGIPTLSTGGKVTATAYSLHNGASNVDNTPAQPTMPVTKTAPGSTTLWNYSTDLPSAGSNTAGRYLDTGGTTSPRYLADWRYQMPGSSKFVGDGYLQLWAAPQSGSLTTNLTFTVTASKLTSTGASSSVLSTQTVSSPVGGWGCAGFRRFYAKVAFGSGSGTSFAANEFLAVSVKVSGGAALLAYDTTTFPALLQLPVKSGG